MWWAGAEPVDLYLDTGGWLVSGAAGPTAGDPALPAGAPVDRFKCGTSDGPCRGNWSACLDAALASRPPGRRGRTAWRVWLGGELARPFLLPVMPRRTSASDRDAAWQALARHALQSDRACRVWVGRGGTAAQPGALGVAAAADEVSEIEGWFAQRRLRLSSLAPWWSGVFDAVLAEPLVGPAPGSTAARAGGGVLAVHDGTTLTMLARAPGAAGAAGWFSRVRSVSGLEDLADAQALWLRAVAAANLPPLTSPQTSPQTSPLLALRPPWAAEGRAATGLHPGFKGPLSEWTRRCLV